MNNRAPGSSRRQRSLLQAGAAHRLFSGGECCVVALRVSSFLPLSSVFPRSLPPLPLIIPPPAHPGAQTRSCRFFFFFFSSCCGCRGSYRRGSDVAITALPFSLFPAARARCLHVLLVSCRRTVLFLFHQVSVQCAL